MPARKTDRATLDRLAAVSAQHRELTAATKALRVRRDFLIIAAVRRGIPYRAIAQAAGVHYTRIQQLAEAGDEVSGQADVETKPRRKPKKKKS
jgi:transposase